MNDAEKEARHAAAEKLHEVLYGDTDGLYGNATFAANAAIDAFLSVLGRTHVVAPREATEAMVDAYVSDAHGKTFADIARAAWTAMLKAAETPPPPTT